MCGENAVHGFLPCGASGSPPRVRGKPDIYSLRGVEQRITPACAGKTSAFVRMRACISDHPRVCGENVPLSAGIVVLCGSPPRVRGKLATVSKTDLKGRITPACAGKTMC